MLFHFGVDIHVDSVDYGLHSSLIFSVWYISVHVNSVSFLFFYFLFFFLVWLKSSLKQMHLNKKLKRIAYSVCLIWSNVAYLLFISSGILLTLTIILIHSESFISWFHHLKIHRRKLRGPFLNATTDLNPTDMNGNAKWWLYKRECVLNLTALNSRYFN